MRAVIVVVSVANEAGNCLLEEVGSRPGALTTGRSVAWRTGLVHTAPLSGPAIWSQPIIFFMVIIVVVRVIVMITVVVEMTVVVTIFFISIMAMMRMLKNIRYKVIRMAMGILRRLYRMLVSTHTMC